MSLVQNNTTIDYYNQNAFEFFSRTVDIDIGSLYKRFIHYVLSNGSILDAGCGSGRDTLYFKNNGYQVSAFDASAELASLASRLTGLPVQVERFQNINFENCYDGIWACASLLHVPRSEIDDVFSRLTNALKPNGALYTSFKYGDNEEIRNGRFFNNYNEQSLRELLYKHPTLHLVDTWKTVDIRPDRTEEFWLNAILCKTT